MIKLLFKHLNLQTELLYRNISIYSQNFSMSKILTVMGRDEKGCKMNVDSVKSLSLFLSLFLSLSFIFFIFFHMQIQVLINYSLRLRA